MMRREWAYQNQTSKITSTRSIYLRMKNYARCIEDADKPIEMEPEYVKAYHRRGKAYLATNKFELAIRDFQFILEKNPDDQDINQSLKSARAKL